MNWKPREQKILEGTYRSDRDSSTKSPVSSILDKAPTPYKEYLLSSVGKKQYKKLCNILIEQNRLSLADIPLVENLSRAYQDYFTAISTIEDKGVIMESINKNGQTYLHKNPAFTVRKEMEDIIIKLCTQLGITPYTRSRLNLELPPQDTEEEDFLRNSQSI